MSKTFRILKLDKHLMPYRADIEQRMRLYNEALERLYTRGSLSDFANGHHYFGFHTEHNSWVYREWAPGAETMALMGDFNDWDAASHPMTRLANGQWELRSDGELPHGSKVRVVIRHAGECLERIPLYVKRAVQNPETGSFDGVIWSPAPYCWQDMGFKPAKKLFIYECHIGMSGEKEEISTFEAFRLNILPRIKKLGYTAIQIMAIMEHPYYASFGYQVSNFFAVASRFGTPEDLKALVDEAHRIGIAVIMDLVHSHMIKNTVEGPSQFDGTDYQFCHAGTRGDHPAWNTRLFDYGKPEVLHFLLSNVKYWLEEYHLDGFRFDGVTSMLYHHHGLGLAFDHYSKYFSTDTDTQAVTYLQLAAAVAREVRPKAVLIAEDMSGMPGMCLPIRDGGIGFDYRLNMGLPDYLIKLIQRNDEDWDLGVLWYELTTRRPMEKVVGYTESHDQALVGDKTLIFWLADQDMYWHMQKEDSNPVIDRALSLHKMLRLITCSVGGDGYLNFMGNEFGHPEWIDFPREGNDWSYHYCRRQWSLEENPQLKYQYLSSFDHAMLKCLRGKHNSGKHVRLRFIDQKNKLIVFDKGSDTFVFNFHPTLGYAYSTESDGVYKIALHTGWTRFGGHVSEDSAGCVNGNVRITADRRTAMVIRRLR